MQIFDTIIIGTGPSGLFTAVNSPFEDKKLILEKNNTPGIKLLMSGGERCNFSNMYIDINSDYFSNNKKALNSIFAKYSNYDFLDFLDKNNIKYVEEDNGRLILKSGKSQELLDLLIKLSKKNNTQIKYNSEIVNIKKENNVFEVESKDLTKYYGKKLVISTGGKSFFQTGTTGDGYNFAKFLGHNITPLYKGLTSIVTKENIEILSGISSIVKIKIIDKLNNKIIFEYTGSILFTHFGLSGPAILNGSLAIGDYLKNYSNKEQNEFLKNNIFINLEFDIDNTAKKIIKFFNFDKENFNIVLNIKELKSWKESKVTGGGINLDELTNIFESKLIKGLYFTGEILDITGKSGGYNLQLCWSSGYIVGKSFFKK